MSERTRRFMECKFIKERMKRITQEFDVTFVGAGIGGLSGACVLKERRPGTTVAILEKEEEVGQGTSHPDHNTGCAHTGCFYPEGSVKAIAVREGFCWLREFHETHSLVRRDIGKIIAASEGGDGAFLRRYQSQALSNGQRPESVKLLSGDELRAEHEPLLSGSVTEGLLLEDCFIFDAGGVMSALKKDLKESGVTIKTGCEVRDIQARPEGWLIVTNEGEFMTRHVVSHAGTHADRIAAMTGGAQDWRIVPVLGAYFELTAEADIRHMIYEPTRKPPFLGVHIMPGADGRPCIGPDVFFSPYRERVGEETSVMGWLTRIVEPFRNIVGFSTVRGAPHFFPIADFYASMLASPDGRAEIVRHFFKGQFATDVQRLINPDLLLIDQSQVTPLKSGIRAQNLDLKTGEISLDMGKEVVVNPHNGDSLAVHDKMPGSPGFTASVGKARWIMKEILEAI